MKKTTIIGAALLMAVFGIKTVKAQTCIKPPSCEELGYTYTEADCGENGILRCPTDLSKVHCSFNTSGNDGDILYADHFTSPVVMANRTPIGIVFDAGSRLAVSLDAQEFGREQVQTFRWGQDGEIPNITSCSGKACNDSGIVNTSAIVSYGQGKGLDFPLVEAARAYSPAGCKQDWCGVGKWSLISMGEVNKILAQKDLVFPGFKALGVQFAPANVKVFVTSSLISDTAFNARLEAAGITTFLAPPRSGERLLDTLPPGLSIYAYRVIRY